MSAADGDLRAIDDFSGNFIEIHQLGWRRRSAASARRDAMPCDAMQVVVVMRFPTFDRPKPILIKTIPAPASSSSNGNNKRPPLSAQLPAPAFHLCATPAGRLLLLLLARRLHLPGADDGAVRSLPFSAASSGCCRRARAARFKNRSEQQKFYYHYYDFHYQIIDELGSRARLRTEGKKRAAR